MLRIYTMYKKSKHIITREELNPGFRFARWKVNEWEIELREEFQGIDLLNELLQKLTKCAKKRFRAILFLYENFRQLIELKEDDGLISAKLDNLLEKLFEIMKIDGKWWIRKWAITALNCYSAITRPKFLMNSEDILNNEKDNDVKNEIIRTIGSMVESNSDEEIIKNVKDVLIKNIENEKDDVVKRNMLKALIKIKPELITIENIKFLLDTKDAIQTIINGKFLANVLKNREYPIDELKHILNDDENNKFINRAMIAWILANIDHKDKADISLLIEDVINKARDDKGRRVEVIWFSLALLRMDLKNIKGVSFWEEMKFLLALSVEHLNEYDNIEKDWYEIEEDVKRLLKNARKEEPYLDVKSEIDITNRVEGIPEMVKDTIALLNSADNNPTTKNTAYLIIGVIEHDQKITSFINFDCDYKLFELQLTQIYEKHLNLKPRFHLEQIRINKLYEWQIQNEISSEIQFTPKQMDPENKDEILVIQLKRESKKVYEVKRKRDNNYDYYKGDSWIRDTSHTDRITQEERERLMKI